jgi:hypothetical protein
MRYLELKYFIWNCMFSAGERLFLLMNCRLLGSLNSEFLKRYPLEGLGIGGKINSQQVLEMFLLSTASQTALGPGAHSASCIVINW